ncbi:MAG: hypothetical protein JWM41_3889 [Gemmatimonadetes bacterium]|nr:hypothetical protein [Gemmatimonadota bacterium]
MIALPLKAQTQLQQSVGFLDVGSEKERVLRVLQILGDVPLYPWSIRQLSPSEQDRLRPKTPAAVALLPAESRVRTFGALKVKVLPIEAQAIYNSAFPYGFNDGPIWAGKGLTGALEGGIAARIGPLSFQLEPMVFDAQNAAFPLAPGTTPQSPVSGYYGGTIDLPQRFGDRAYRRFDLGQSSVRLDVGPVAAEFSTANQWWGPALESPLILGNNAPGYLHASIGTAHPVNIGVGSVHGHVVWGRLEQSPYASIQGPDSLRFMSGFVGVFEPKGIPGLELGAARFFHSPWPTNGLSHASFSRPFEGILKASLESTTNPTGVDADNQLASVFARWAFPQSGLEVYGEYGREDHNIDSRDLWQEPDHDAGYTIGLQRGWHHSSSALLVVRGEVLNTRLSALGQGRLQAPWYVHGVLTQGHTELGQLLGAPGGFGGSGATVALDSYSPNGRWTIRWDRIARAEGRANDGSPIPATSDILHSVGLEREIVRGPISYILQAHAVWDLNRDLAGDRFNSNLTATVRAAW